YQLRADPHRGDRFLFHGTLWITPDDFGLEKAVISPVDDHSWWITHTECTYLSQKIGDFWLPASNHCVSKVRFFGHAVLDITYSDFRLTSASPLELDRDKLLP
ncbi:MAG: hypothetical protein ACRD1E_01710, partial [Terriglobales bacterium]